MALEGFYSQFAFALISKSYLAKANRSPPTPLVFKWPWRDLNPRHLDVSYLSFRNFPIVCYKSLVL